MACCQFADVPTAAFQAVLHQLSSQDHASLRQVSNAVCQRTTQHVPYIIMRLLNSTSTDQLQHCFEATRRLQHVAAVHIRLAGEISAEVFDMAMQLLAKRFGNIKKLRVLDAGTVTTLQPIKHLLCRLKILELTGFAVSQHGMPWELKQLVAAAGQAQGTAWPLQSLVLAAEWSSGMQRPAWSEFPAALHDLATAFPSLRHFEIRLPALDYAIIKRASALTTFSFNPPGKFTTYWQAQLVQVALVTSVFNAAQQMKCLEVLKLVEFSDIWDPDMGSDPTAIVTAATAPPLAAAIVDGSLNGLLPSLRAASEAFKTMDDCGLWLLQHHTAIRELHISTKSQKHWSMSWQQQLQQQSVSAPSSSCASGCSAMGSMSTASCAWSVDLAYFESARAWRSLLDSGSSNSARLMNESPVDEFTQKLAYYSARPVSSVMCHIISLKLNLHRDSHVDGLVALLCELKSLKHLEVSLPMTEDLQRSIAAADTTIAAAAEVQSLQSLNIRTLNLRLHNDLLLPLTTAAGGPGSSLKNLKLRGDFVQAPAEPSEHQPGLHPTSAEAEAAITRTAQAERPHDGSSRPVGHFKGSKAPRDVQRVTDDVGALSIDQAQPTNANVSSSLASAKRHNPFTALQQFSCLGELNISCISRASSHELYVEVLPATLTIMEASYLTIASRAEAGSTAHQSADAAFGEETRDPVGGTRLLDVDPVLQQPDPEVTTLARSCLSLRKLILHKCYLSSPGILASTQLQELDLSHTSWSGGWLAATSAWPNVKKLTCLYPDDDAPFGCGSNNCSEDSRYGDSIDIGSADSSDELSTATSSWTTAESDCEYSAEVPMHHTARTSDSQQAIVDPTSAMLQLFEHLSNGFPHIRALVFWDLPCLSVEVLQPVVQRMEYLHMIELSINRMYGRAMPTCSYLSDANWEERENDSRALQHWLQQQLPQARVVVT